jgi:hypothetical protein
MIRRCALTPIPSPGIELIAEKIAFAPGEGDLGRQIGSKFIKIIYWNRRHDARLREKKVWDILAVSSAFELEAGDLFELGGFDAEYAFYVVFYP